ncbi:ATP-binding cassette domain-containing protein [Bifidobacterium mongoliense]
MLEKVGLSDKSRSYPKELSGGQKQRIGIARALAVNPKLLLLDEPTSSLDPELVGEVETIIEELASDGQTMLAVTHEMSLARRISSKIIFMEHGSILETGSPERIFTNPKQERTSMFLSRYRSEG